MNADYFWLEIFVFSLRVMAEGFLYGCPACMHVLSVLAWCPPGPGEGIRFPDTGVTDGCKLYVMLEIKLRSSGRADTSLN